VLGCGQRISSLSILLRGPIPITSLGSCEERGDSREIVMFDSLSPQASL
jgi:hypothetical protein